MSATRGAGRHQLRLLAPATPHLVSALARPTERKHIQTLTQQLVDALIEMVDLADGDPDLEPNGDEFEPNGDEFEDNDGL